MEMKEQLLMKETLNQTPTTPENKYFVHRYNQVVKFWNHNQTQIVMYPLDESAFFMKVNHLLSKHLTKILFVLLLTFAPFVNMAIFGFFCFYYLFLRKQGKIHKQNLKAVPNPFQDYIFYSETLEQLGKHCAKLTLKKEEEGFTFNKKSFDDLKAKQNKTSEGKSSLVTVVVFDQYFYDSFFMVRTEQYKVGGWIVLSALLIGADVLFYLSILNMI